MTSIHFTQNKLRSCIKCMYLKSGKCTLHEKRVKYKEVMTCKYWFMVLPQNNPRLFRQLVNENNKMARRVK